MSTAESISVQIPEPKYRRLLRISALANIAAWIALVFFVVLAAFSILRQVDILEVTCPSIANSNDPFATLMQRLAREPWFAIQVLFDCLQYAVDGMVSFGVLKGVGLGLDMIVETDMNRRNSQTDGDHE